MRCALLVLLASAASCAWAAQVNISNVVPRVDQAGNILDAHDGNVFYDAVSGQYVWIAASYGSCKEPAGNTGCSGAAPGGRRAP